MKRSGLLMLCVAGLLLWECKPEQPQWEATYTVPLVNTVLGVHDVVADSLIQEEADGSLTLVYRNQLDEIRLDSLLKIQDNAFSQTARLADISLPNNTFDADITLGMIALNWPVWGPIVIQQNGSSLLMPDITGMTSGPHPSDIQDIFETATFTEGFMDITVTNEFPAPVANLDYEIRNANSGTLFLVHSFPYIASGGTANATIDLAGRTLEGAIDASLLNMDFLVGNQVVPIDTSKALDITITLRDMKISTATALFPAQTVVDEQVFTYIDPGNAELQFATLKTGNVRINVVSTAQDTIFFNYKVPGASKDGEVFETNTVIPPAAPGSNTEVEFNYDFADYTLDLRGPSLSDKNLLYSELIGRIDSTNQMVTISLQDSLQVSLYIENITVQSARGFLGSYNVTVGPEEVDFRLFEKVLSGRLELEEVSASFTIENELGVAGELQLHRLHAFNSNYNDSLNLVGSITSAPITIERRANPTAAPAVSSFSLQSDNSNITQLMNVNPDNLEYAFDLNINPGIDSASSDYQDFLDVDARVKSSIDIEMPMTVRADQLSLRDTAALGSEVQLEFDNVKEATIHFIVRNGFPLSTGFEVDFIDDSGELITSLIAEEEVKAGTVVNGRVTEPGFTVLSFPLSASVLPRLSSAAQIVFTATFNTPGSEKTKLYSDYQLAVTVSGDLKYHHE